MPTIKTVKHNKDNYSSNAALTKASEGPEAAIWLMSLQ